MVRRKDGFHLRALLRCDGFRPAQEGADAGGKLVHAERLGQVVVGAEIERFHLLPLAADSRQDEYRQRLRPLADTAAHFQAVHLARQHQIEDDQIGHMAGRFPQGFLAGGRERDGVPLCAQAGAQGAKNLRLVIHHENAADL